jgi:hypothetical protein
VSAEAQRRWRSNPENKAKYLQASREWKKRNRKRCIQHETRYVHRYPEKKNAWNLVYKAVRSGRLIRPTGCSRCGKRCKPEAHHPDYSKPLEVVWLCEVCHKNER